MLLTGTGAAGGGMLQIVIVWGIFLVVIYFIMLRPQKKEQKRVSAMLASLEVGDVVVTTSGFYGVLIDITDEDVIVEFGSNRNCRIPMKKAAIQEVEKQN
ncbi:MAG: preprotein translocase subunit YajC [Lachnospiraceae bacterium]